MKCQQFFIKIKQNVENLSVFCYFFSMKKSFFVQILILSSVFAFFSCSRVKSSDSFTSMNTFMTIQVFSSSSKKGEEACQKVKEEILGLEKILSTTISESDLYKINHAEGKTLAVHAPVKEICDFSSEIYIKTGGLFNPSLYPLIHEWGFTTEQYKIPDDETISRLLSFTDFSKISFSPSDSGGLSFLLSLQPGMQLDFGAIAKGYAGDRALELLSGMGISSAIINLGGNVQALGKKSDGSLWRVGIKNPWGEKPVCSVSIDSKAVVTSGGYERFFTGEDGKRYIHIFDPRTGRPAQSDLESVTIICGKGIYADALSTSLFVMGKDRAVDFWRASGDFEFILLTKNQELVCSCSIKDFIEILYPFKEVIVAQL